MRPGLQRQCMAPCYFSIPSSTLTIWRLGLIYAGDSLSHMTSLGNQLIQLRLLEGKAHTDYPKLILILIIFMVLLMISQWLHVEVTIFWMYQVKLNTLLEQISHCLFHFQLEDNCFTVLRQLLLYNRNQLQVYVYPLPPEPAYTTCPAPPPVITEHRAEFPVLHGRLPLAISLSYAWQCASVNATSSVHPLLPPPDCVRRFLFSVSWHHAFLLCNSLIRAISLDSMYMHEHMIFVFLFLGVTSLWVHPPHSNCLKFDPIYG